MQRVHEIVEPVIGAVNAAYGSGDRFEQRVTCRDAVHPCSVDAFKLADVTRRKRVGLALPGAKPDLFAGAVQVYRDEENRSGHIQKLSHGRDPGQVFFWAPLTLRPRKSLCPRIFLTVDAFSHAPPTFGLRKLCRARLREKFRFGKLARTSPLAKSRDGEPGDPIGPTDLVTVDAADSRAREFL